MLRPLFRCCQIRIMRLNLINLYDLIYVCIFCLAKHKLIKVLIIFDCTEEIFNLKYK